MALRDPIQYARDLRWAAWEAYIPTWTGSGSNPAIGDGSIGGRWRREGATGWCRGKIKMGSTTTYGTGGWSVSLPAGWVAASGLTDGWQTGNGVYFGAATYRGDCYVAPSGTTLTFVHASPWAAVTGTVPFTWATNHFLTWNICLELN